MAIYHASTKPIARSAGRSAVAAAAYRAGVDLVDARTGLVHDYTRKGGVELTEILTPDGIGVERNALWDAAELAEKRKDSRTAREWIVALPAELDAGQRTELARDFAQALVERYGVAADLSIHAPDREGDHRNHHAHLLTTTRQFSRAPDGGLVLGAKAHIELSDKARRERGLGAAADEVKAVRELWEHTANAALERAGVEARIDARSLQAQGVDREATQHLGPVASEMERRGKESDRGDGNREVSVNNEERARLSAEIIDLHAERERRERREAVRREFEASHRDARPDVVLTARIVAHRVAELAMLEQLDIRCRWNERWVRNGEKEEQARLATIEAEREARRQKLLDLAETLRTDVEARADLEKAYAEAGYRLEEREGRHVLAYPMDELEVERRTIFAARKAWNVRKQEQEQKRLELDSATEQESRPGVRHPARPQWPVWRERVLTEAYDAELAGRYKDCYRVYRNQDGSLTLTDHKNVTVTDYGDRIVAKEGNAAEIALLLEEARAKGWGHLDLTGGEDFRRRAAQAAIVAGFTLADPQLEQEARRIIEEQSRRERIQERAMVRHGYRVDGWEIREHWHWRQQEREQRQEAERQMEQHLEREQARREAVAKLLEGTHASEANSLEQRLGALQRHARSVGAEELRQARQAARVAYDQNATGTRGKWVEEGRRQGGWEKALAAYQAQHREAATGLMAWTPSRKAEAGKVEGQIRMLQTILSEREQAASQGEQALRKQREQGAATWAALSPYAEAAREAFQEQRAVWIEEQRLAAIEKDRQERRKKLQDLAEILRNDAEAKTDLREAYPAAGYQLEERAGKSVWTYPHDDLTAERQAVRDGRTFWDQARTKRRALEACEEAGAAIQRAAGAGTERGCDDATWNRVQADARKAVDHACKVGLTTEQAESGILAGQREVLLEQERALQRGLSTPGW
ncbi:MobQ family relaxase (plasmid) [Acidithiobacillus ferruginosus]|uniref:MobQ family relaxase n=1 Tax=Acidithiobacillus ferruginosus TaxID=3063951 RepID=A0ACD5IM44_9PROT